MGTASSPGRGLGPLQLWLLRLCIGLLATSSNVAGVAVHRRAHAGQEAFLSNGRGSVDEEVLPRALCGALLEQTYGALKGWAPTYRQLNAMCKGLMVSQMRMVRSKATAAAPCRSFA